MLELKNIVKIFKSPKNKIKAIDNTSLKFGDNGLVTLLGPSGCGKTTLLNAVGGLDKVTAGEIIVNGIKYKNVSQIDEIRNSNIGYIFQDYKLINNLSVFDNVAIVLKMLGVKDKGEIKARVEYVLNLVSMLRYKKRPAAMLSGGERQRVAIARAIVKNPKIILADEPTGNLDSKNSLEIMKIISAISKTKLVILVTHEKKLAQFYSDRIIELLDGKVVNDYQNNHTDSLEYEIENNIYLKDFSNINNINNELYDINLYNNNSQVKLDIVIKNGNIYIKSDQKVTVLDNDSKIELINDHYKKIEKDSINSYDLNTNLLEIENKKYTSIFNVFSFLKVGFKKVFKFSVLKKLLLVGFFISAIFTTFAISSLIGALNYDDSEFLTYDKDYILVDAKNLSVDDYNEIKNIDGTIVFPNDSLVDVYLTYNEYIQAVFGATIHASLSVSEITSVAYGKLPGENEIVIDQLLLENAMINNQNFKMVGLTEMTDFIGLTVNINDKKYIISGITANENPVIYINTDHIDDFIDYNGVYDYSKYNLNLIEGEYPLLNEVIVSKNSNKMIGDLVRIEGIAYTVVGIYDDNYDYSFTNYETMLTNILNTTTKLAINTDNKDETIKELNSLGFTAKDSYEVSKSNYVESMMEFNLIIIAISLIVLAISITEILLMIRSSFLSRVKEVGIYRAIGVKKSDIYKIFIGEIIAITTLVSLPGVILMAYVLSNIPYVDSLFEVNGIVIMLSIFVVYVINIIAGLIPVFGTIIKTPNYILSRNDVE